MCINDVSNGVVMDGCVFLVCRGCTDILCCILFIIALLGYFAVGILGKSQEGLYFSSVINENVYKMLAPLASSTVHDEE